MSNAQQGKPVGRKKSDPGFTNIEHDPQCPHAVVVVQRLLKYHDFLHDLKQRNGGESVCSSDLADYACCGSLLVRRDFSSIGIQGQARVGYSVKDALAGFESVLGRKGVPKALFFGHSGKETARPGHRANAADPAANQGGDAAAEMDRPRPRGRARAGTQRGGLVHSPFGRFAGGGAGDPTDLPSRPAVSLRQCRYHRTFSNPWLDEDAEPVCLSPDCVRPTSLAVRH